MYWVRACTGELVWMSALVSSEALAIETAAEWMMIDNVTEVEVERREPCIQ